jgi:glucose/arabinose dehydrogenase
MKQLAAALLLLPIAAGCQAAERSGTGVAAALHAPPGFAVNVFAEGLDGARFLALSPSGVVYLTQPGRGQVVALPDADGDGKADRVEVVARGLDRPHGIVFHAGALWIAETGRVLRFPNDRGGPAGRPQVVVRGLPSGGNHWTRTITFGPKDGMLYVSVGSSCNLCEERDPRRAAILRYRPDGSGQEIFARGLRNAVGLAWNPITGELWATHNERDMLGDDLPPEEIVNIIQRGGDYGWPYCYGNRIPNPEYGDAARCANTIAPAITDTAHSAPLGCAFYTGNQFPREYHGDFFVCYHGSWNRSRPTGYKVVRVRVRDGRPWKIEPFLTGFRTGEEPPIGRPVDALVARDGSLLISDDSGGRVFRVRYVGAGGARSAP